MQLLLLVAMQSLPSYLADLKNKNVNLIKNFWITCVYKYKTILFVLLSIFNWTSSRPGPVSSQTSKKCL